MHYGAYGFAVDPTIPTIIVPDGVSIGQRVGFSEVIFLIFLIFARVREYFAYTRYTYWHFYTPMIGWFIQAERPLRMPS